MDILLSFCDDLAEAFPSAELPLLLAAIEAPYPSCSEDEDTELLSWWQ